MAFTGESFCSVGYRGNSRSWMCMSNGGVIRRHLEFLRVAGGWCTQAPYVILV